KLAAGRKCYSRIPTGMPRLNPDLERSVYFAFGQNPKTGAIVGPGGTGVIVSRESSTSPDFRHYYAITNHHVAISSNLSMVRVNTVGSGSRLIEFDPEQWVFRNGGHDIAAVDITDEIYLETDEIIAVTEKLFVTQEFISRVVVGFGEDVF